MRNKTFKENILKNLQPIIIGLLLGLTTALLGILLFEKTDSQQSASTKMVEPVQQLSSDEFVRQREVWTEKMQEVGTVAAYNEFKEVYKNQSFGTQHMMAHIIGELLYSEAGLNGLSVCDSTFAFGCYHSYFSQALLDNGIEIIKKLDSECLKKFGPLGSGCQHGIGHGVSEYFGPGKLTEALESCKDTTQPSELAGCVSGVFMEYNVPILITETNASSVPRPMENNDPYAPCPSLPKKFQPSCYYELPQWWGQGPFHKDTTKHGKLCEKAPNKDMIETCFLGLGNILAPNVGYSVENTLAGCALMPNQEGQTMCQAGASWSFDANPDYRHLATQMCNNLTEGHTGICQHKAHLLNPSNQ